MLPEAWRARGGTLQSREADCEALPPPLTKSPGASSRVLGGLPREGGIFFRTFLATRPGFFTPMANLKIAGTVLTDDRSKLLGGPG
jgi:hypothetical protein